MVKSKRYKVQITFYVYIDVEIENMIMCYQQNTEKQKKTAGFGASITSICH
jgi:hypothetical protein